MSLSIPDYNDPQDVSGTIMPGAYAWIADITISYANNRASFSLWVHRSDEAAATWPIDARIAPAGTARVSCGDPVPGFPDVVFPSLEAVMTRAATIAAAWMAEGDPDGSILAGIATGGAIRASLYAYLNELVFPNATEVE